MILLQILLAAFLATSCTKQQTSQNNGEPANLNVKAVVNTSNNGEVAFEATANNAVAFDFDFGDGTTQSANYGIITHQYQSSGTYSVKVKAHSASGKTATTSIQVVINIVSGLVWSDEFNTPGAPDASKWVYETGDGCPNLCGWGNNELQYYTSRPENVFVSGGTLKIKAKTENYSGRSYTSARIITKDKFSFKYGKVEVRAKLPEGAGTWPAIWMLGSNINSAGWPACGEIDIMEYKGSQPNVVHGTFHYPGASGGNANTNSRAISNASSEFHVYGLEWSASQIRILVDGQLVHSLANNASLPYNQPFFFILNVAMGGGFGGPVEPSFTSSSMEIDYIRVYN